MYGHQSMRQLQPSRQTLISRTVCKKRFTKDPFPVVLHDMLRDIEEKELSDAISWLPNGRGFIISKPHDLAKHILPNWFQHKTYSSFQRQLNLYNFQRIKDVGVNKGCGTAYYHKLFIKGKRLLSFDMRRFPIKNEGLHSRHIEGKPWLLLPPQQKDPIDISDHSSTRPMESGSNTIHSSTKTTQEFLTFSSKWKVFQKIEQQQEELRKHPLRIEHDHIEGVLLQNFPSPIQQKQYGGISSSVASCALSTCSRQSAVDDNTDEERQALNNTFHWLTRPNHALHDKLFDPEISSEIIITFLS